ncbi:MAG: LysR family transcriptional regulator [Parvibaculum sp.]
MSFKGLDLNLLVVLDVLLKEQNVTRAAAKLNLTQSAVSSALKRLRLALNDELLVLVGRRMQLTPRAETLRPRVVALMSQIDETIAQDEFDPATSNRRFVIASADYSTLTIVPSLLGLMGSEAPHMRLQILDLTDRTMPEMHLGRIDAIIAPRSPLLSEGLRSRTLFKERLVCITARNHPEVRGNIDLATFRRLPQVRYQPGRDVTASGEALQLKKQRIEFESLVTCPSFVALPFLVGATNAIALLQERLALRFLKPAKLQILPPPIRTDPLDITLFWTPNQNSDMAHRWLRDAIHRVSQKI